MNRERAEFLGSMLWFLMDGFWMMEWIPAAKACFVAVFLVIAWQGLNVVRLRRIRLPEPPSK